MKPQERSELIDALLDGAISEADFLRLEAELHVDEKARRDYYERLELTTLLEIQAEAEAADLEERIVPMPATGRRTAWFATAGIAAVILGAIALLSVVWAPDPAGGPLAAKIDSRLEPSATGFAVLTNQADAVWDSGGALTEGDLMPQGDLHLTSGVIQVEFFSGVTVILEGEADFTIHSPMEMSVRRGKLRARVPAPAKGFRIRTAEGELVDLGTEFGLDVTEQHSEVHVLDGEVEWSPKSEAMRRLAKGKAIRSGNGGGTVELSAQPGAFIDATGLEEKRAAVRASRRSAWLTHSRELRRDSRLLAYYPFDQPAHWNRTLTDESGSRLDGAIVAAQRSTDRFGFPAGALDFSPTGSRVRVNVPGEHRSLTFLCWVRIDSLDRWYNSLFLTDGHELGEPHWQIMDDGRLFFSVKKRDATKKQKDKQVFYSPAFWTPALSGRWLQIATTLDLDARKVTHYLNGKILSEEAIEDEYLVEIVRIGPASIGNWSDPSRDDPHFAVRNFNGSMDEFAIFGTALSATEIAELYENGKP